MSQKGPSKKKKGRSKKAHVLSAAVMKATENFIGKGEEIANENPEIRNEMLAAVDDVRKTGELSNLLHMCLVFFFIYLLSYFHVIKCVSLVQIMLTSIPHVLFQLG